jgi:outer membrane protein assembly factor BamB
MNAVVRLGASKRFTSTARGWLLFLFIGMLAVMLAFPIYAAKGGNGKGGGKGGNGGGGSGPIPEQHHLWSTQLLGPYSGVRPVVAPDGTIYAVDVFDNLFAVNPENGTPIWINANAGSKGVDIGVNANGDVTIYTGNENWIKAFYADGTLKWTFTQTPRAFVTQDIAVGPDGHIYVLSSSGMGVFSLADTPLGPELRWSNPEAYGRPFTGYVELAFGPTLHGDDQQLYFYANGHTRAVRLSDGASVFTIGGNNQQPQVSPLDGTWHTGPSSYSPDSTLVWTFQYPSFTTAREPSMGQSGMHYAVQAARTVYAIDPLGVEKWNQTMNEYVGGPDVDPGESQLLLSAGGGVLPVAMRSISARNGSSLWRMEFPADPSGLNQFVDTGVAFSPDGSTAYVVTALAGGNVSYLHAIDTDPSLPSASTMLRSRSIDMSGRSKGWSVTITGVVTVIDENLNPVSGATVNATWTLADGSTVDVSATTSGSGEAKFSQRGDGGLYWLEITDIALSGYTFDPDRSLLVAGQAWF